MSENQRTESLRAHTTGPGAIELAQLGNVDVSFVARLLARRVEVNS